MLYPILIKRFTLALSVVSGCVGCGLKGDLYLPRDSASRTGSTQVLPPTPPVTRSDPPPPIAPAPKQP